MPVDHSLDVPASPRERLGSLMLLAGAVLLVLRGVESQTGLPGMPRYWYQNEALWWLIALGFAFGGACLAWAAPALETTPELWRPSRPGRRFRRVVLYTKENCPLCEEMEEELHLYSRWLPMTERADIANDAQLMQRFGPWIPVLEFDGKVRFRGRLNAALLRRLIEGTPPLSH